MLSRKRDGHTITKTSICAFIKRSLPGLLSKNTYLLVASRRNSRSKDGHARETAVSSLPPPKVTKQSCPSRPPPVIHGPAALYLMGMWLRCGG